MYSSLGSYSQLPPGTEIRVWTDGGVYHHGIADWNGNVIHARKGHGVIRTSQVDFSYGKPIEKLRTPSSARHREEILQRTNRCIGVPYDLLTFNCEHFASWAWGEPPRSRQLATAVVLVAGVGLAAFALSRG